MSVFTTDDGMHDATGNSLKDEDHYELRMEIVKALDEGVKMNREDVIALWSLTEAFPEFHTRRCWLEVGFQNWGPFNEKTQEEEKLLGTGWQHILAGHIGDFVEKGIQEGHLFPRLSQALLTSDIFKVETGARPSVTFLEDADSQPWLMVVCLGSNGFIVTTFPRSLVPQQTVTDGLSKRKRTPGQSEKTVTTLKNIRNLTTEAYVLTQNAPDALRYHEVQGGTFFCSPEYHFEESLASAISAFGIKNSDFVHGLYWNGIEADKMASLRHDAEGLALAFRIRERAGKPVYYQFWTSGLYHLVRWTTQRDFLKDCISLTKGAVDIESRPPSSAANTPFPKRVRTM